jgi:hypothetical protein
MLQRDKLWLLGECLFRCTKLRHPKVNSVGGVSVRDIVTEDSGKWSAYIMFRCKILKCDGMQGKTTKKHDKNGQIAFFKIFDLFILIIWAKDVPLKYLSPYIW